jgi:glycosyltransferase involved in cell wall biosynthesis
VDVIYNGISLAKFSNENDGASARSQLRHEIGVREDDLLLLQVARLDALKDHLTAVRTLQRVTQLRRNVKLVLAGEGPELEAISAEVRKLSLQPFVRFLGLRNDVPRLMRAADMLLLTSISEGIPLTVIEAMAAGLPVVATRVGGLPEIVEEGRTGWLAPAGDDEELATAVLRLADNRSLQLEMGAAGRRRAEAMFSDEQMNAAYGRLYEEMLHARNAC